MVTYAQFFFTFSHLVVRRKQVTLGCSRDYVFRPWGIINFGCSSKGEVVGQGTTVVRIQWQFKTKICTTIETIPGRQIASKFLRKNSSAGFPTLCQPLWIAARRTKPKIAPCADCPLSFHSPQTFVASMPLSSNELLTWHAGPVSSLWSQTLLFLYLCRVLSEIKVRWQLELCANIALCQRVILDLTLLAGAWGNHEPPDCNLLVPTVSLSELRKHKVCALRRFLNHFSFQQIHYVLD